MKTFVPPPPGTKETLDALLAFDTRPRGGAHLVLYGHYDVAALDTDGQAPLPPLEEREGLWLGRGVAYNKEPLAARFPPLAQLNSPPGTHLVHPRRGGDGLESGPLGVPGATAPV